MNKTYYKLNYTNVEVRKTFAEFLSDNYSTAETTLKKSVSIRLVDSLLNGKPEEFMNLLKIYLQKVDYSLSSKITEYYFEFAVSNIINMLGLVCVNEVHTAMDEWTALFLPEITSISLNLKQTRPWKTRYGR